MKILNDFYEKVGIDRVFHFIMGVLVCFMTALVMAKVDPGFTPVTYAGEGFCGAVFVGIVKESLDFFDSTSEDSFDLFDILATILGGIVGFLLLWGIL